MWFTSIVKFSLFLFIFNSTIIYAKPLELTFAFQNTINYPYQTENNNNINWNKPGILLEMLKLVEKKINIKIHFKRFPWKRALFELKEGNVDGLFEASFKKKRLEFGLYPLKNGKVDEQRRTNYNSYYLYKRKKSKLSWNGIFFKYASKGICAEREYSIVDDLRKKGVIVLELSETTKCLLLLNSNKVDGVAALQLAGDTIIKKNKNMSNIVKVKPSLSTKAYYLMLSHQFVKKHPKIAEIIWDTIAEVRESQDMELINKKYF